MILPAANALEASLVNGAKLRLTDHLSEVVAALGGRPLRLQPCAARARAQATAPARTVLRIAGATSADPAISHAHRKPLPDLCRGARPIRRQARAGNRRRRRARTADDRSARCRQDAAGAATAGPAAALVRAGNSRSGKPGVRRGPPTEPRRPPAVSQSAAHRVGGGADRRRRHCEPGELSLAHLGVLFLDELPEFPRNALEALREPLESGVVVVARLKRTCEFPAQFQLVAAMNPCPCGYAGDPRGRCHCTAEQVVALPQSHFRAADRSHRHARRTRRAAGGAICWAKRRPGRDRRRTRRRWPHAWPRHESCNCSGKGNSMRG